ncbi:hypothetical protein LTR28_006841 [Elasticomyces elasticus]|nr:hypothetical protein LTR28_006841 [Elasticomyces elasticus]
MVLSTTFASNILGGTDGRALRLQGHFTGQASLELLEDSQERLTAGFGDHNGLLGVLSSAGKVYTIARDPSAPSQITLLPPGPDSPPIGHLALADNGRVAVTFTQAPNANLTHISEFTTLHHFHAWHRAPTSSHPAAHHMLPGRTAQLAANSATFALLTDAGDVYTWGDPRHRSLGRSPDPQHPANRPCAVDALAGLRVRKLASGGWVTAALSCDCALYVWGSVASGAGSRGLDFGTPGEEVALVAVGDGDDDGDALDVLDVAVGDGHCVVVAEGGRLFGVGENANGELGLGPCAPGLVERWTEIERGGMGVAARVWCGPKGTFVQSIERTGESLQGPQETVNYGLGAKRRR